MTRLPAESRLPIEMFPLPNVATGVVEPVAAHPIRVFFDRGLLATVNSDGPAMSCNSMSRESGVLMKDRSFSPDEVRRLIPNGVHASWLSLRRRADLDSTFARDPAWRESPA